MAHGVSAAGGNHAVCYCDDCQSFQHFLGRASDVLDSRGGTEIFQMSAAQVSFTAGREHLACMRLSPRGMCRWHAGCCNTPIGNTLPTPSIPFVGLVVSCLACPADDPSLQASLGPIRWRAFRKFAQGGTTAVPPGETLASAVLRFLALGLMWRLRGDGKRTPFFDPQTGRPVVQPRVLTLEERDALRQRL
jgi:Family of unknown function (DUF6151)